MAGVLLFETEMVVVRCNMILVACPYICRASLFTPFPKGYDLALIDMTMANMEQGLIDAGLKESENVRKPGHPRKCVLYL